MLKAYKSTRVVYKEHQTKSKKEGTQKTTPSYIQDPTSLWNQPNVYILHLYIP